MDNAKENGFRTAQEIYSTKDKEVKANIRKDKRDYLERKTTEAEEAALVGDSKTLFGITRQLSQNSFMNVCGKFLDNTGKAITTEQGQMKMWENYFKEILNQPEPLLTTQVEVTRQENLEMETGPIKLDEIHQFLPPFTRL